MKTLSIFLSLCLAVSAQSAQLTVHAASSLTDAMKEIGAAYEKQSGDEVRLNFDASSVLARQIEEGAPADVFLSADEAKMDALEKAGYLAPGTRKTLLSNTLVIVVPFDSTLKIQSAADLAGDEVKKIAISQPTSVPVGIYSKEYLSKLGLWDKLASKVVPTQNVRASLAAVESGNVEAGFVYKTDAAISKKVKIVYEVPIDKGPKITYPAAIVKESKHKDTARDFINYLQSPSAKDAFKKYGFVVLN